MAEGVLKRSVLTAATIAVLFPAQAPAAATFGQTFEPTTNCGPRTRVQSEAPGDTYKAPFSGVITFWSFQASSAGGSSPLKLKVARHISGDDALIVGESATESIPDQDILLTFPTRISVQGGDSLGLYSAPPSVFLCARSAPGYGVHEGPFGSDLAVGTTHTLSGVPSLQLDVSATLERDVDGDGYGDETQDACPGDPTTQAPCPDIKPPETTIDKKPPKQTSKRKAKVTFSADESGATFACKLDKKPYKPCTSPLKLKHLDVGKHKLKVRATDAAGNVETTPAKAKFRVLD